jgi:F-type H+-transporting ATPase subunit b
MLIMDNPLVQPDPGLAIWTIITFLVLLWLLAKYAWRPLLRVLEARRETIKKSMEDAEQAKRELERLNRESAQILKNAHTEAESILSKGRADADKFREEMKQKARADAEAITREAQRHIETETGRALRRIRSEIAEMSVAIASKLIQRNFTVEDNSELIEETLKRMESDNRPS